MPYIGHTIIEATSSQQDLDAGIGRHLREHAADQSARKPLQACPDSLQDSKVPFRVGLRRPDRRGCHPFGSCNHHRHLPGAAFMTALYSILRAIDDSLFDRVFQPLLDRTGWSPARLAPAVLGASFAVFLARVLVLHGNGQLAEHVLDAGVPVAASANLYRFYLGRAANIGGPNMRRHHWVYMGLRLVMLTALHVYLLVIAVAGTFPVDMAFVFLAEALCTVGFYVGACEPPRPPPRRVPSHLPGLGASTPPHA